MTLRGHLVIWLQASSPGHSHFLNDKRRERGAGELGISTRRHARDARDRSDLVGCGHATRLLTLPVFLDGY